MVSEKRNYAVDAIKGIMILLIVLHHLHLIPILKHGYLAVDMFFIIAGYYLSNRFYTKGGTATQYTIRRIKAIYLPYLVSLLLASFLDYKRLLSFKGFEGFMETYGPYASFLTFTEEMGFIDHWPIVLYGGWFLSVLIISGFLLFGLLEYDERKTIKVILPFSIIFGFTYLFSINPSTDNFSRIGAISIPFLRGFLDMGLGVLLFNLIKENQAFLQRRKSLATILACLAFMFFVGLLFVQKTMDSYYVIAFPLILTGAVLPDAPIKHLFERCPTRILAWLGSLSLEIYVIHQPAIHIVHSSFKYLGIPNQPTVKTLSCLVFVIIAAVLLRVFCGYVRRLCRKKQVTQKQEN